ncbi:hypothetical protein ANANG_G00024150 [Anguilla anguilla]|uniref:Papilin n=1 Tax=Anguilla anguilla TaxID=7936 RepID=A0A9D3N203_ANGAN|nr:hypothetical protein ANANG_G00024150 [Anguilla anguilla]
MPPQAAGHRGVCSEPRLPGPCSDWTARYYYDPAAGACSHFWYGGCQGNGNNFASREDCQRECQGWPGASRTRCRWRRAGREGGRRRRRRRARPFAGHEEGVHRVLLREAAGASTGAASEAHRAQVRLRRPAPDQVQNAESMAGVSIDQSDPSTVEGRVGQRVVLPCRVTPLPSSTVVVEWRRDGVPLTAGRHQQQPNGSLLVGPLTLQDSGWLLCVATRGQERDHRYIYLSVSESPQTDPGDQSPFPEVPGHNSPRFSIDQSGSSLVQRRVKQTARLPCRISPASASSSVNIEWTKNGLPVNSLRHTQQSDGSLVIGPLTSEDSGFYTCTASTHHQREHRQLQLKVAEALRITTAPNNVHVSRGSTAHLPCVVSGDNVNVGWSRNGVPVRPDGGRVQVSVDGSLILNNVQPADEGAYTCNAYIGTFSVSATAEVRVSKDTQPGPGLGLPSDCVDQPELANCELIVYARLCSSQYYSSFCCASCARHSRGRRRAGLGLRGAGPRETLAARFRQDTFAVVQKGSSVQLPCQQDGTQEYMYWYRQFAGQGLVLLYLSRYEGMAAENESKDPRFSAARPNRQNFPLNVTGLQLNDTATYYCASSVDLLQVLQSPLDLVLRPGSPAKVTCSVYGTSSPFTYWYRRTPTEGIHSWFSSLGTGSVDPPSRDGFSASRPNDSHFVLESAGVAEADPAVWYCAGSTHGNESQAGGCTIKAPL